MIGLEQGIKELMMAERGGQGRRTLRRGNNTDDIRVFQKKGKEKLFRGVQVRGLRGRAAV